MGNRWALHVLLVCVFGIALHPGAVRADTGGSMGGGDWSSSSSSSGGGGYSSGGGGYSSGDYSSGGSYSSGSSSGTGNLGLDLVIVVGILVFWMISAAIKERSSGLDTLGVYDPTEATNVGDSVDVTVLRIAIDGRA